MVEKSPNGGRLLQLALLLVEFVVLTLLAWGVYPPLRSETEFYLVVVGNAPEILRIVLEFGLIIFWIVSLDADKNAQGRFRLKDFHVGLEFIVNIASAFALALLLIFLQETTKDGGPRAHFVIYILTTMLWASLIVSSAAMFYSPRYIFSIIKRKILVLLAAGLVFIPLQSEHYSVGALFSDYYDRNSSAIMSPVLWLATVVDRLFGLDPKIEFLPGHAPIFGTDNFKAEITFSCSGYEGVIIIFLISIILFYVDGRISNVKQKIALISVGTIFVFLLNIIRIALIILIGSRWSPIVAEKGFHSYIGWINIIMTTALLRYLLLKLNNRADSRKNERFDDLINIANPRNVAPLGVLIFLSIVLHLFTGDFYWLYPVQVIITIMFVFAYRANLSVQYEIPGAVPLLVGLGVFVLWIAVIPPDIQANRAFERELFGAGDASAYGWLIMRIVGAAIVVPFAEELAFRGYLQPLVIDALAKTRFAEWRSSIGVVAGSVAFGAMHSNFFAGFLAGLAYGVLAVSSKGLTAPIMSHAITNTVLALYVLITENWSYW